jgi:hypothetical protein
MTGPGQCYIPRGVQRAAILKATHQSAGRRINIHLTQARTIGYQQTTILIQHICHRNVIFDCPHIDRAASAHQRTPGYCARHHHRSLNRWSRFILEGLRVPLLLCHLDKMPRRYPAFAFICHVSIHLEISAAVVRSAREESCSNFHFSSLAYRHLLSTP